ncbi:SNF2 family N-terminal domain-containing protein [Phyllosticta citribraziliensis]|uniref:SNF2 family N-terminal domain-containing protein n=1 Tax=Phyllosticta citribraziliensis TaxID=989973 RepID=A0ABR1L9W9_9PEZI
MPNAAGSTRSSARLQSSFTNQAKDDTSSDELAAVPKTKGRPSILKEVAIMVPSRNASSLKATSSSSVSPVADYGSLDGAADADTPGTSYSNTPAPSMSSKRKRAPRSTQQTSHDEELARMLQEEEYTGQTSSKRAKLAIKDSDDDDDESDPLPSRPNRFAIEETDDEYLSSVPDTNAESEDDFIPLSPGNKGKGRALPAADSKGKGKAVANVKGKGRADAPSHPSPRGRTQKPILIDSDDGLNAIDDSDDAESGDSDEDDEDDVPLMKRSGVQYKTTKQGYQAPVLSEATRQRLQDEYSTLDVRVRRKKRNRDNWERSHPEIKTMWKELEKIPKIPPKQAPQPTTITRKLKSFQLEGLNWMIKQEQTKWKGGLLGDEMGMGKTIQAVSLIMSDYDRVRVPTLVVVPPVALMQWSSEIKEYTNGKLKVLVFHGSNTKSKKQFSSTKELKKFDVIIISYNTLESLYRKETKGWSRGEDIVKQASPVHAIEFHRIILDEAHCIKTRVTGSAKACFALKSKYKWCLSGTPVQNRIGEFFSLLRFLEIRPFADYFCKSCSCAQLHWNVDEEYKCTECHHAAAQHLSVFNQELLNPITSDDPDARSTALDKLHLITSRIMLRRMKRDYTSSMELPPKEVIIHNEFFGEVERDFHTSIMTNSQRKFDTYVSRGVMLNNYANIFGMIMQLRQAANHPDLILKKKAETGQNVLVCNICDEPAEDAIKSRCHHEFCRSCIKDYVQTCKGSDEGAGADCPRCHIPLSIDLQQPEIEQEEDLVKKNSIINRIKMENWTSSTKIEMLVYDLYKLRSKRQTLKSIVFSQFTSMLALIEWRLRRAGFNTVMLDGSMSPTQRQKSIEYFMNNADVEVFLVSLKAGGVALNLTEASRVFIVDPWWNPAAEWQSADRCHRIGQKRPCVITRLVVEDSVESRIVMLQEKKAALISSTVNQDKVAMEKLTPEDMQFLFRGT